jgi:hypothetical protein
MMKRLAVVGLFGALCLQAVAQGTKLWTQSRYDEMERGTADGVAIRSDGRLEVAPATSLLYTTSGSYVWSIAADAAGNTFLGRGGTTAGSAVISKVAPDGTASEIFAGKELAVQALHAAADGVLFAATSPDGKVYRIETGDKGAAAVARVVFDPAETAEKPKYLWDLALGKSGELYVAAGAPAAVYRVPPGGGRAQLLFKTADQHIRCLLLGPNGLLYAGSDGGGVIYRIDTTRQGSPPFAVYSAAKREVTSLAMDAAGNVYAAAVGAKGPVSLPNLPVTGGTGVTITFVPAGSANAASTNTVIPEGSEIYKIAPDGSPAKLLALKDDVVYALTVRNGSLLAATGNRGRIYRIDTEVAGRWTDIAHLDAAQAMAFAPVASGKAGSAGKAGLVVATSNSGRIFRLEDAGAADATFTSAVYDAGIYSQWGRAEVLPASLAAGSELFVRTGNIENPAMGWSEWKQATPNSGSVEIPGGRYAQWKVVLRGSASVESVGLNYLAKNVAPVVDEVVVQTGARMAAAPPAANTTVSINFPAPGASSAMSFTADAATQPLIAQKDRTAVTVRWAAHDDNGDDLMFAVYYKGEGEANWRLLKDKISDRFYSFDSALLPDGLYTSKVVASDSPVHTDADALTGERASGVFVVDTTPPGVTDLHLTINGSKIHVTAKASDTTSPIGHAEYSLDAGPWQYVEPSSKLSDSNTESYVFDAPLPVDYSHEKACSSAGNDEHVLALRVYDRSENASSAKARIERSCVVLTSGKKQQSK